MVENFNGFIEREEVRITQSGTYTFKDNCELILKDYKYKWLSNCNIVCGDNCNVDCGNNCNITCGNNCVIKCLTLCTINCGNNCKIYNRPFYCYIKAGEGSQLKPFGYLIKSIYNNEKYIWWFIDENKKLINTFEDVDWKNKNPNKWNEFYGFVHNELDSSTLF